MSRLVSKRGEVAGFRDHRAGGRTEVDAELPRHDLGQRRLAKSWRTGEQNVVKRLAPRLCRVDEYLQVAFGLGLADELAEPLRPQMRVGPVILAHVAGNHPFVHRTSSLSATRMSASVAALITRLLHRGADGSPRLHVAVTEIDKRRNCVGRRGRFSSVELALQPGQHGIARCKGRRLVF